MEPLAGGEAPTLPLNPIHYADLVQIALTLNPSPKKGEGLQPSSPSPILGEGAGDVELALPEGWASQTWQRFHRLLRNG